MGFAMMDISCVDLFGKVVLPGKFSGTLKTARNWKISLVIKSELLDSEKRMEFVWILEWNGLCKVEILRRYFWQAHTEADHEESNSEIFGGGLLK